MRSDDPRFPGELAGIEVIEGDDTVTLVARTRSEAAMLANAHRNLGLIAPYGVAPRASVFLRPDLHTARLRLERIRDDGVTSETELLWGACNLLAALQACSLQHGDLSTKNLALRGGRPIALDWQESASIDEHIPPKRPEGDAAVLWRSAVELSGDQDRVFRRWQAMRPHLTGVSAIVDLGCGEGRFCRLAEVDSDAAAITGIDQSASAGLVFLAHCERATFEQRDLREVGPADVEGCTVFCLSVWAHLAAQWGDEPAWRWLRAIVEAADQVLYETHYMGDGPRREVRFPRDPSDLRAAFAALGIEHELLTEIPVHGRDAVRTVWRLHLG